MLRKTIVALFAIASIGMLVPDVAAARGGFGGGGFRGGGGFHGGGFRAGGIGMGGAGFRAASIGPGFRSAGPVGFRAAGPVGFRGGTLAANSFRGGYFRPGFRHRGFPYAAAAVVGAGLAYGAGYPYGYYDDSYYYGGGPYYANYPYDDEGNYAYGAGYYPEGGCYVVRQRIPTPYGWVLRPVQVCN
jgi:hypothetical protein